MKAIPSLLSLLIDCVEREKGNKGRKTNLSLRGRLGCLPQKKRRDWLFFFPAAPLLFIKMFDWKEEKQGRRSNKTNHFFNNWMEEMNCFCLRSWNEIKSINCGTCGGPAIDWNWFIHLPRSVSSLGLHLCCCLPLHQLTSFITFIPLIDCRPTTLRSLWIDLLFMNWLGCLIGFASFRRSHCRTGGHNPPQLTNPAQSSSITTFHLSFWFHQFFKFLQSKTKESNTN